MSDTMIERVRLFYDFYQEIIKNELDDIFVSDIITSEGSKFQHLWFFNSTHCMECRDFVSTFRADMAPLRGIKR